MYAQGINVVNKLLYDASKLYNFDLVFNLQFQVQGVQNVNLFTKDKLHLSKQGVQRLAMNFKYQLRKNFNYWVNREVIIFKTSLNKYAPQS